MAEVRQEPAAEVRREPLPKCDANPLPKKERIAKAGFRPPLDIVDGAGRVDDLIVRGEVGDPVAGVLLNDAREAPW